MALARHDETIEVTPNSKKPNEIISTFLCYILILNYINKPHVMLLTRATVTGQSWSTDSPLSLYQLKSAAINKIRNMIASLSADQNSFAED